MTLDEMIKSWSGLKKLEKQYADARTEMEYKIYEAVQHELKPTGTNTVGEAIEMKIVTGFTEKWDTNGVSMIFSDFEQKFGVSAPFRVELKPDNKGVAYIKENMPDAYEFLQKFLTTSIKKPSFSVKGGDDDSN